MIKAIVFDIGGVLIDLDIERCLKAFREDAGFKRIGECLDPCHQRGVIGNLESGAVTEDEFITSVLEECPEGTTPDTIRKCFCALLNSVSPEKVEYINELKDHYDLYLLSNNNPITMRYTEEEFAKVGIPFSIFKDKFISCDLKLLKPSPEIFQEVIRRIGLPAEEILFVDDSMRNVEGAESQGINGLYYDLKSSFRDTVSAALK